MLRRLAMARSNISCALSASSIVRTFLAISGINYLLVEKPQSDQLLIDGNLSD